MPSYESISANTSEPKTKISLIFHNIAIIEFVLRIFLCPQIEYDEGEAHGHEYQNNDAS